MSVATSRPTRAVVDLGAIRSNVARLVSVAAPAELCVVVKADAYGHGAVAVAAEVVAAGAGWLATAVVEEAVDLRRAGIDVPLLVLAPAPAAALGDAIAHGVALTVDAAAAVDAVVEAARAAGASTPVAVHLKVDTGMHRMGVAPSEAVALARRVVEAPELELAGTWTHLARADEPDQPTTDDQLDRFDAVLDELRRAGIAPGRVHAANSGGTLAHPRARHDLVRCGIATWGVPPAPGLVGSEDLEAALSWVSAVSAVRRVPAGDGVSYGHRWTAPSERTVVTVPVGYADGVRRDAGARGVEVLVGGRRRSVVGAVTMDQLLVDVGDDAVGVGDEVVLIGRQGGEAITATEWSERLGTIAYEVLCAIGPRVPRFHVS